MNKEIFYKGNPLTLIDFYAEPVLWIHGPSQINIPKMEFVGGFPNEYCIKVANLTEEERQEIKDENGNVVNISREFDEIACKDVAEAMLKYSNRYIVIHGVLNKDLYPEKIQKLFAKELKKRNITDEEIEQIRKEKEEKIEQL